MTLSEYAAKTIGELIEKVASQAAEVGKDASEHRIHDLRVAIRRLSETLRVFEDVCLEESAVAVRKDLREAMQLAGSIRNHDIAIDLAGKAKVKLNDSFEAERAQVVRDLCEVLAQWNSGRIFKTWRTQLHAQKARQRT